MHAVASANASCKYTHISHIHQMLYVNSLPNINNDDYIVIFVQPYQMVLCPSPEKIVWHVLCPNPSDLRSYHIQNYITDTFGSIGRRPYVATSSTLRVPYHICRRECIKWLTLLIIRSVVDYEPVNAPIHHSLPPPLCTNSETIPSPVAENHRDLFLNIHTAPFHILMDRG